MSFIEEIFNKAVELSEMRQWDEAIGILKKCLNVDPLSPDIHRSLVHCLSIRGLLDQVIQEHMRYIEALFSTNSFNEIKHAAAGLLNLSTDREETLKMLIKLYNTGGEPEELYRLTLELARLYVNEEKRSRAVKLLTKVYRSDLQDRHTREELARLLARVDLWEECISTIEKIIADAAMAGSEGEQERISQFILQTVKNEQVADLMYAEVNLRFLRVSEALRYYEKILAAESDNKEALRGKGNVFFQTGEYPLAIEIYKKVLQLDSNDTKAMKGIAESYVQLQDIQNAVRQYRFMARICAMNESYEEACRIYEEILRLDRDNSLVEREYDRLKKKMAHPRGAQREKAAKPELLHSGRTETDSAPDQGLLEILSDEDKKKESTRKEGLLKRTDSLPARQTGEMETGGEAEAPKPARNAKIAPKAFSTRKAHVPPVTSGEDEAAAPPKVDDIIEDSPDLSFISDLIAEDYGWSMSYDESESAQKREPSGAPMGLTSYSLSGEGKDSPRGTVMESSPLEAPFEPSPPAPAMEYLLSEMKERMEMKQEDEGTPGRTLPPITPPVEKSSLPGKSLDEHIKEGASGLGPLPFELSLDREKETGYARLSGMKISPPLQTPFAPQALPVSREQFTAEGGEILEMLERSLNFYESRWFLGIFSVAGKLLWYARTQGIPRDVALELQTFSGLFDDFTLLRSVKTPVLVLEFRSKVYQFYFLSPGCYLLLIVYSSMNLSALHVKMLSAQRELSRKLFYESGSPGSRVRGEGTSGK